MANLKNNTPDDVCVYLAFNLTNDLSINSQKSRIRSLLHNQFGDDEVTEITNSHIDLVQEVIFEIDVPVVRSSDIMNDFFQKIELVLNVTSNFIPHFTQIPDAIKEVK